MMKMDMDSYWKEKDDRFQRRMPHLIELGFVFDESRGVAYLGGEYSLYWERIVCDNDEEWIKHIDFIRAQIGLK